MSSRKNQLINLYQKYDGRCVYCNTPTVFSGTREGPAASRDHLVPRSRQRRNNNHTLGLVLACNGCNSKRGNMHIVGWVSKCIKEGKNTPQFFKQIFSEKIKEMNEDIHFVRTYKDGKYKSRKRSELDRDLIRAVMYIDKHYGDSENGHS